MDATGIRVICTETHKVFVRGTGSIRDVGDAHDIGDERERASFSCQALADGRGPANQQPYFVVTCEYPLSLVRPFCVNLNRVIPRKITRDTIGRRDFGASFVGG